MITLDEDMIKTLKAQGWRSKEQVYEACMEMRISTAEIIFKEIEGHDDYGIVINPRKTDWYQSLKAKYVKEEL